MSIITSYYDDFAEAASKFRVLDLEKAARLAKDLSKHTEDADPLVIDMAKEDLKSLIRSMHDLAASILAVEIYLSENTDI